MVLQRCFLFLFDLAEVFSLLIWSCRGVFSFLFWDWQKRWVGGVVVLRDERMMMGIDVVNTLPGTGNYSVVPLTHTQRKSVFSPMSCGTKR